MPASKKNSGKSAKVGSDKRGTDKLGGKLDFGDPVHKDVVRFNGDDPIDRPAGSSIGVGPNPGRRTFGVSSRGQGDGDSSAGDVDTDFVGIAGSGGLSQSPADHVTTGPDATTGRGDEFASGKHARGEKAPPEPKNEKGKGSRHPLPDAHTGRQAASENSYDPQDTE